MEKRELSVDKEKLAFLVREEYDEIDYEGIYARRLPKIMNTRKKYGRAVYVPSFFAGKSIHLNATGASEYR